MGSVALIQNYLYVSHGIWVSDLLTKLLCFDFLKKSGCLVQIILILVAFTCKTFGEIFELL
jgi:hypothetical protein